MNVTHRDPVCGMELTPEIAEATTEYQGRMYFFCSVDHKEAFERNPENYVVPEDNPR